MGHLEDENKFKGLFVSHSNVYIPLTPNDTMTC